MPPSRMRLWTAIGAIAVGAAVGVTIGFAHAQDPLAPGPTPGSPTPAATAAGSASPTPSAPEPSSVSGGGVVFAAGGDFGAKSSTSATLDAVAGSDAEFLLALGDLSYSDTTAQGWCDFVKAHLGADFPVELLVGNHEDDDRVDGYIGDYAACLPDRMGSTGTYAAEYYFDVADLARVIMIGAGNDVAGEKYDYEAGNSHYRWLESTIDEARAAGIPWVIVGAHKPCITAGQKSCEVGSDLYDLLLDKRVDLILHGHEHNFQLSKQLTCATPLVYRPDCVADDGSDGLYTKGAGSVFVVTGATGGSGIYQINTADPEYPYLAASDSTGRGYLQVSLDADHLDLDYIGTSNTYTHHTTIQRTTTR